MRRKEIMIIQRWPITCCRISPRVLHHSYVTFQIAEECYFRCTNSHYRTSYTVSLIFSTFSGRAIGIPEKVQPFPGQRLRDCLEHRLRQRGLVPSSMLFFVENSRTPLPDNCDANFLSGQRIVARGNFVPYFLEKWNF